MKKTASCYILTLLIFPMLSWAQGNKVFVQPRNILAPDDAPASDAKLIAEKVRQGDRLFAVARDLGGMDQLRRMLQNGTSDQIKRTLGAYGIRHYDYTQLADRQAMNQGLMAAPNSIDPDAAPFLSACAQFLPQWLHNTSHKLDATQTYIIDNAGRTSYAQWIGSPEQGTPTPSPRCQTSVGAWGISGDEGGHLIATVIGGSPWRINLTPQNSNLNRGAWQAYLDKTLLFCRSKVKTIYTASPRYQDITSVRPWAYGVRVLFEFSLATGDVYTIPTNAAGGTPEPALIPNRALEPGEKTGVSQYATFLVGACSTSLN